MLSVRYLLELFNRQSINDYAFRSITQIFYAQPTSNFGDLQMLWWYSSGRGNADEYPWNLPTTKVMFQITLSSEA